MSEDGGRPRRRRNNDGKQHAAVFYSATKEEAEVVSLSSDVETDSDWQWSSDSEGDGKSSDKDMVVEEEKKGGLDLASLSESVSRLLHPETRSVDGAHLKLVDCKAYLRNHGLRVGGTKAVCLDRINEHLRIKDGNGE